MLQHFQRFCHSRSSRPACDFNKESIVTYLGVLCLITAIHSAYLQSVSTSKGWHFSCNISGSNHSSIQYCIHWFGTMMGIGLQKESYEIIGGTQSPAAVLLSWIKTCIQMCGHSEVQCLSSSSPAVWQQSARCNALFSCSPPGVILILEGVGNAWTGGLENRSAACPASARQSYMQ